MTSFHVSLKRFDIGAFGLEKEKISRAHRKRVESCLSKYFLKHADEYRARKGLVQFDISAMKGTDEYRDILRVVRHYQHAGCMQREPLPKDVALIDRTSREVISALYKESLPGANGQILAGMRLADDTLSFTRSVIRSISPYGSNDPIAGHLGYYAGIFWSFLGFREVDTGVIEYKRAVVIGDKEGQRRSCTRVLSGAVVGTGALFYLGGKISDTLSSATLSTAFTSLSGGFFGLGSLVAMGSSYLGAVRCYRFNQRLIEYLENPKLTEVERLKGALTFLKDSISVTAEECAEIASEIEQKNPNLTLEEKQDLIREKISALTESKVKYLKRRTSHRSLNLILSKADILLNKLENPRTQAEGIEEVTALLKTIQKENKKKFVLFALGFIASLIGFAAMISGTFFTAGTLPFILYGISGAIYMGMSIYGMAGMLLKKDPDDRNDLHPIQDTGHDLPHL